MYKDQLVDYLISPERQLLQSQEMPLLRPANNTRGNRIFMTIFVNIGSDSADIGKKFLPIICNNICHRN